MIWRNCRVHSPSMAVVNRYRGGLTCPRNIAIDNLEESDNDFIIYYGDLMEGDSAPIMNILEFLVRSIHSLVLTRIVIKMVIVGSQMDTLVVKVRYLGKFVGTNFGCWSYKRKVSLKFCEDFFCESSQSVCQKMKKILENKALLF